MRGSATFVIAAALAGIAASEASAAPPVARPTPCPCAADGTCYPKRDTWGYYPARWRQWPGDTRPEIPGPLEPPKEGELPTELDELEIPRPEEEDVRAPISRRERERLEEPGADEERGLEDGAPAPLNGLNVPPLEFPFPTEPNNNLPGLGVPPGAPNQGLQLDPPPGLPFPQERLGEPGANVNPRAQHRLGAAQPSRQDADFPPVLPSSLIAQTFTSGDSRAVRTTYQRLPSVATVPSRGRSMPRVDGQVRHARADRPASSPKHVIGRAVFTVPATGGNVISR